MPATATTAQPKTRKKALPPQEEAHILYKDPARQAQMAGLRYATDQGPGLTRKATRAGKFAYYDAHGEKRDFITGLLERYDPLLRWALGHRKIVALASVGVLVATVVLLARLPSDFLPKMDEGQFEIAYTLPVGTTLEASDAAATEMERVIASDAAVAAVGRLTGIDSNGFTPTQSNQGLLRVRLKPPGGRAAYDEVSTRLRDRLSATVPSSLYDFHQILEDLINGLSGTPAPIEIMMVVVIRNGK